MNKKNCLNDLKERSIFYEERIINEKKNHCNKDTLLKANSLLIYDNKNQEIISEIKNVYPIHYYPLSIVDYANLIKDMVQNNKEELPILSISSKDYPYCDFKCEDCLASSTSKWAIEELEEPVLKINKYKRILKQISKFSRERGVPSVRYEICGEGNPDMYKYRDKIIKYARKKCNMGLVYISTGSKLSPKLKKALVKYASYIRISLPGISNQAYEFYSNQNKFTFEDSIKLLSELVYLRKKYNRSNSLLIGVRTCMRNLNNGHYIEFAKKLGEIGVDSLQVVKVLINNNEIIEKNSLDNETQNEILELSASYKKYGLKHLEVPDVLDKLYIDRSLSKVNKPEKCYSSIISPILYGSRLVVCTHWDKIKNFSEYHYGILSGKNKDIENVMYSAKAQDIRNKIPQSCDNCCALKDNLLLEKIKTIISSCDNLADIKFLISINED